MTKNYDLNNPEVTHRQRELIRRIKQSHADQHQQLTDQYLIELALEVYYELENPQEMLD